MKTTLVEIKVSDPWELGESIIWQPLHGEIVCVVSNKLGGGALIRLHESLNYLGAKWDYLIASPRHHGVEIIGIENGKSVGCGVTGITEAQAKSDAPFDLSAWRGGLAFIGDVSGVIEDSRSQRPQ